MIQTLMIKDASKYRNIAFDLCKSTVLKNIKEKRAEKHSLPFLYPIVDNEQLNQYESLIHNKFFINVSHFSIIFFYCQRR